MADRNYFTFVLSGEKELMDAFAELPNAVGKDVLVEICNRAAQPVVDAAKALAPHGLHHDPTKAGNLRDSIGVRKWKGRKWSGVVIGPRWPEGAHGHLVEFGTGPRYMPNGKYVGRMTPHPFMRPAWDANKDRALAILREEVWDVLMQAAEKLRRKAEKGTLGRAARRALGGW